MLNYRQLLAVATTRILKIFSLSKLYLSKKLTNILKSTKAIQKGNLCRVSCALFGLFYGAPFEK